MILLYLKKIILIACVLILLVLTAVVGVGLYVYHHPSRVKTLSEKSLSWATGISCTIGQMSYSLHPLRLRMEGVLLTSPRNGEGLRADISEIQADMGMEGAFGHKTLVVKRLDLGGLQIIMKRELHFPGIGAKKGGNAFLGRMAKALTAFLFFQDLRFEDVSLSEGQWIVHLGDAEIRGSHLQAFLSEDRLLSVSGILRAKWPSMGLQMDIPDFRMVTENGLSVTNPEIKARITAPHISFEGPAEKIKSAGLGGVFVYSAREHVFTLLDMSLDLEGLEISYGPEIRVFPKPIQLKALGTLDFKEKRMNIQPLTLVSGDFLSVKFGLKASMDPEAVYELDILDGKLIPEDLKILLPNRIQNQLSHVHLEGPVSVRGRISGRRKENAWELDGDLESRFRGNPYRYEHRRITPAGILTGTVRVRGRYPEMVLSIDATSDETRVPGTGIVHEPSQVRLSLSGRYPVYTVKRIAVHCPFADVPFQSKKVPVKGIRLEISDGLVDVERRYFDLPDIIMDSSLLRNLRLTAKGSEKEFLLSCRGNQSGLIHSTLAAEMMPSGWKIQGKDEWHFGLQREDKGPWEFDFHMGLQNVSFQGPEGRVMGEDIAMKENLKGEYFPNERRIEAKTALDLDAGEVLLDRFYLDLAKNSVSVSGNGRYRFSEGIGEVTRVSMKLKDILETDIDGSFRQGNTGPLIEMNTSIRETAITPIFQHFLLEPFKATHPGLEKIGLGGTLGADVKVERTPGNWDISGGLRWRNGKVQWENQGNFLEGMNLLIPLWFHRGSDYGNRPAKSGFLTIKEARLPILGTQSLDLRLEGGRNSLKSLSPFDLKVPGGVIRLRPFHASDIFSSGRSVTAGLDINIQDVYPLLAGRFPIEVHGPVKGTLNSVRFMEDSLSTTGRVNAGFFGGEIILSGLSASGLFSPSPVCRLSVLFSDLRLEQLTAGTEFGKIEGVMQGRIKGLELAYGQPQSFDLWMETVEKEGVPKRISVEAVDNIARIGGGQSPFVGMAGILTSFFREFPYKKIGIHTTLENDIFTINGTIKEGGKEYLVKRSGFSGVDVINQNPDNRIRFKDMVKRIKFALSSKGKPVIK